MLIDYYVRLKEGVTNKDFDLEKSEIYQLLFCESVSADHARKALRVLDLVVENQKLIPENNSSDKELDEKIVNLINKTAIEINKDGSQSSNRIIEMNENDCKNDEFLLKVHGYNTEEWELISAKSSIWNTYSKIDGVIELYSSKISVKPKVKLWSFEDIDKYFENKEFSYINPNYTQTNYDINGEILEITLPDFHGGLLSWHGETGEDYDILKAKERFNKCLEDILYRIKERKFAQIYFVPLGDLLHTDTINNTTSKGTLQDCDGRFTKMFDNVLDMIIDAVEILSKFTKVEVPYISGNHDRLTGYALMKAVSKAFRNDKNVIIDITPNPRKFRKEGKVLIGWTHGDMPKQNISEWLQVEARKE